MVRVLSRPSAGSSPKRIGRDLSQPFNRHLNRGSVLEENWRSLPESKNQKSAGREELLCINRQSAFKRVAFVGPADRRTNYQRKKLMSNFVEEVNDGKFEQPVLRPSVRAVSSWQLIFQQSKVNNGAS